jgi:hypothetical protein
VRRSEEFRNNLERTRKAPERREAPWREEYKSYRRADENPHEGYLGVSKAAYLKRGLKRFNLCVRVKKKSILYLRCAQQQKGRRRGNG